MKKNKIILFLFLGMLHAQVSIPDMNRIGNNELDEIRAELQSIDNIEDSNDIESEPVNIVIADNNNTVDNRYFGYNYFQTEINFFDNIPTPSDFKLGAGDEIILSLWGEQNSREKFIINKEGFIYYKNVGFISLSNKTIEEAEVLLANELSNIYSTLKDSINSTKLMVELGKLRSLNIYFSGEISQPGIQLVHPFSDIFVALVHAGGVKREGSLRDIQIIRDGEIINRVDFYTFFSKGSNNFSSIRLIDGDIVHVPVVKSRVELRGSVTRPGFYEVLEDDNLNDIINYAAGLKADASSNVTIDTIIPIGSRSSSDNGMSSININLNDKKNIFFNNGDVIFVQQMGETLSKVEILGRVKNPGEYSATNSSLKDILDIAGGFEDPIFRKTIRDDNITVLRKDENQFYGLEFNVPYASADSFELVAEDKIFVYEDTRYDNLLSFQVRGEVNKRGNFQLIQGMTVRDAIEMAEGLTELGNENAIIVTELFSSLDEQGNEIIQRSQVSDVTLDFPISDRSTINVLPFENVVRVQGNVYNPGLIVYSGPKSVDKYINLAGGTRPNTLNNRVYVQRANGRIKKVSLLRGLGINVRPGDTIVVPLDPDPQDFDITAFITDLASTLANIAAILVIAENQND